MKGNKSLELNFNTEFVTVVLWKNFHWKGKVIESLVQFHAQKGVTKSFFLYRLVGKIYRHKGMVKVVLFHAVPFHIWTGSQKNDYRENTLWSIYFNYCYDFKHNLKNMLYIEQYRYFLENLVIGCKDFISACKFLETIVESN